MSKIVSIIQKQMKKLLSLADNYWLFSDKDKKLHLKLEVCHRLYYTEGYLCVLARGNDIKKCY